MLATLRVLHAYFLSSWLSKSLGLATIYELVLSLYILSIPFILKLFTLKQIKCLDAEGTYTISRLLSSNSRLSKMGSTEVLVPTEPAVEKPFVVSANWQAPGPAAYDFRTELSPLRGTRCSRKLLNLYYWTTFTRKTLQLPS